MCIKGASEKYSKFKDLDIEKHYQYTHVMYSKNT